MWHWTEPLSIQPWALDVKLGLLWQLEILNPAPYYSTNPMVIWKIFQNHLSAHKYQNISWGKPSRRKRRSFIAFGVLSSMLLSIWLRSVIAGSNLHLTYIFPVSLPLQCEQWACVNRNYERADDGQLSVFATVDPPCQGQSLLHYGQVVHIRLKTATKLHSMSEK